MVESASSITKPKPPPPSHLPLMKLLGGGKTNNNTNMKEAEDAFQDSRGRGVLGILQYGFEIFFSFELLCAVVAVLNCCIIDDRNVLVYKTI